MALSSFILETFIFRFFLLQTSETSSSCMWGTLSDKGWVKRRNAYVQNYWWLVMKWIKMYYNPIAQKSWIFITCQIIYNDNYDKGLLFKELYYCSKVICNYFHWTAIISHQALSLFNQELHQSAKKSYLVCHLRGNHGTIKVLHRTLCQKRGKKATTRTFQRTLEQLGFTFHECE